MFRDLISLWSKVQVVHDCISTVHMFPHMRTVRNLAFIDSFVPSKIFFTITGSASRELSTQ